MEDILDQPTEVEQQDPPKKYPMSQQVLSDFSATISAKPNLTQSELFSKFPEFHNDQKLLQSVLDYSATAQSGKYKTVDELNSKFPEFDFAQKKSSSQDLSSGQQNSFDPNSFMKQSRAATIQKPVKDNVPSTTAPTLITKQRTDALQQSKVNQQKAKPVVDPVKSLKPTDAEPQVSNEFNPTDFIKSELAAAYPEINPEEIISHKSTLEQFTQNKLTEIDKQIEELNHQQIAENATTQGANSDIAQGVNLHIKPLIPQENKTETQGRIDALRIKKESYQRTINYFGSIHAGLESGGDAQKAGVLLRQFSGDKQVAQDERLKDEGYGNPTTEYHNAKLGLQALSTTLDAQYSQDPNNPEYLAKKQELATKNATLLDDPKYAEVKKKQIATIIGNYLSKDTPEWQKMLGIGGRNEEDIKRAGKELGLDVSGIESDDVPTAPSIASGLVGSFYHGILGMGASIARAGGSLAGIDKDWLDYHLNKAQSDAQERFAAPENDQLQQPGTIVDANPNSETYLQDIANPNKGKYNWRGSVIANAVSSGIGGLAEFIAVNKGLGKLIGTAAPEILATEKGLKLQHDLAMMGTMFGGYEDHYQKSGSIVGTSDADELKRHLLATLGVYIDKRVFDFIPQEKLAGALGLGKKEAMEGVGTVIKNLPSDLKGLKKELLEPPLKKAVQVVLDATGETAKINSAATAGIIANQLASTLVGTKEGSKQALDNVPEEIKSLWEGSAFNMLIPLGLAEVVNVRKQSKFRSESLYEAGMNPEHAIAINQKLVASGQMTAEQGAAKAEVIQAAAKAVNGLPDVSPVTGKKLTHDDRVKYTTNQLKQAALKNSLEAVKDDPALSSILKEQQKIVVAENLNILHGIEPVESATDNVSHETKEVSKEAPEIKPSVNLTEEANDLLKGLTSGSKPTFITKNLERIAKENGIEVTDKMSADDVVNALNKKQNDTPIAEPVKEPLPENEIKPEESLNEVQPKTLFTESKALNEQWNNLKEKQGERQAKKIYENATRLINPNENNIVEIRPAGLVTKEGEKYTFHPYIDTDLKKWRLGKPMDVSEQFKSKENNAPKEQSVSEPKITEQPNEKTSFTGKEIEPHPEVNTDFETVAKELKLTDVEKTVYTELKDVKPEEREQAFEAIKDEKQDSPDKLDKSIESIERDQDDIDREIDSIDNSEMTASQKKSAKNKLEKQYDSLSKQIEGIEKQKEGIIKDHDALLGYDVNDANDLIDRVNARLATRESVKSGNDLFPADANIPEIKPNKSEERIARQKIKKVEADKIIEDGGLTLETLEKHKDVLSKEQYEAIKKTLNENERPITESKADGQENTGDVVNKETGDKGDKAAEIKDTEGQQPNTTGDVQPESKTPKNTDKEQVGKVAFARSNSYEAYKLIHPKETVEDYNKVRNSEVEIPTGDLRKMGKEYVKNIPEENIKKNAGDALRDIADFVAKGKINKLGGFRSSTGFDAVWDASLTLVSKALNEGAKLADAIQKGIEYIKGTDWYKNLSDNKKDDFLEKYHPFMEKELNGMAGNFSKWKTFAIEQLMAEDGKLDFPTFKDRFLNKFNADEETSNISLNEIFAEAQKEYNKSAKPGDTKGIINKNTGVSPDKAKISMTEKAALKNQLKFEAKAARNVENVRRDLSKAIAGHLKDAVKKGIINVKQATMLARRASNVGINPERLRDFIDYSSKVIDDANYKDKLSSGKDLRIKIKNAIKSKSVQKAANNISDVNSFLRLDPAKVESIDEYNEIAQRILTNSKGISVRIKDGEAKVSNETYEVNNLAIKRYVDEQQRFGEKEAVRKLTEKYQDLVDAGVIDPEKMSLKDMREIIDAINSDNVEEGEAFLIKQAEKEEKVKALRDVLDYQKLGLEEWNKGQDLSPEQKEIVSNLLSINTGKLDIKQLAKLNDVVNNIVVNNSFTDAGNISILSKVQKNNETLIKQEKQSGIKLGDIKNSIINGLSSINLMTEFIAKSSKMAAEIQRLTGISDIYNGHAQAKKMQDTAIREYMKLKRKSGKDIDSAENRFRRGVFARVVQNFGGDSKVTRAEFERTKGLVKQTADRLEQSSVTREQQEGRIINKVYSELLEGAESIEDVRSKMDKINKNNIPIVDFWMKKFEDGKAETAENTELFDNKLFEEVNNYTATKMRGIEGEAGITAGNERDVFEQIYFSKKVDNKMAGTKNSRTRSPLLPKNSVLDLDFDKVQSEKYYETNYDVKTKKAIAQTRMFFESQEAKDILGGQSNKKIVLNSVRKSVLMQKGKTPPMEAIERTITNVVNVAQAKGARIALGSLSQLPKQYVSVAFNTLVNLGSDLGLYVKALTVPNNIKLFDKYNIGLRGETQAGYNKELDFGHIDRVELGNKIEHIQVETSKLSTKLSDLALATLTKSDVSVARTSWLSYYMQDFKRQGIDISKINWKEEHLKSNDEAAAYAEQMVSRTQNANDASSMGDFYKDSKGINGIFKNIFLPFSTFSSNQRMRMTNDAQKILFGGEKAEAIKSIAATATEQVLFNAIKVYVLGALTTAGARGIASMFGFWDDDDEKEAKENENIKVTAGGKDMNVSSNFKKTVANSMSDFFFSGMGTVTQNTLQKGMNKVYGLVAAEQYASGRTNNAPSLFYQYDPAKGGDADFSPYGLYGILPQKVQEMSKTASVAITGEADKYYKGGRSDIAEFDRVKVTPDERSLYSLSFAIDALAITGIGDAELNVLNSKLKTIMKKKMLERYGGKEDMEIFKKGVWKDGK